MSLSEEHGAAFAPSRAGRDGTYSTPEKTRECQPTRGWGPETRPSGRTQTERCVEEAQLPGWSARALSPSPGSNLGPSLLAHRPVSSLLCLWNQAPGHGLPVPPLLHGGCWAPRPTGAPRRPEPQAEGFTGGGVGGLLRGAVGRDPYVTQDKAGAAV